MWLEPQVGQEGGVMVRRRGIRGWCRLCRGAELRRVVRLGRVRIGLCRGKIIGRTVCSCFRRFRLLWRCADCRGWYCSFCWRDHRNW